VGELRDALPRLANDGVDPTQVWALEGHHPYRVDITWSAGGGRDGCMDAVFSHRSVDSSRRRAALTALSQRAAFPSATWDSYATNPLRNQQMNQLIPALRTYLQTRLPDFMVPPVIVALDALPL